MATNKETLEERISGFINGVTLICKKWDIENEIKFRPAYTFTADYGGSKYVKIMQHDGQDGVGKRIYCFINRKNGDVYKAATYKAPTIDARGNIFNDDYGIEHCGPFGIQYKDTHGRFV